MKKKIKKLLTLDFLSLIAFPLALFFILYFNYKKVILYSEGPFYSPGNISEKKLQQDLSNPYTDWVLGRLFNLLPDLNWYDFCVYNDSAYVKDGKRITRGADEIRVTFSQNLPILSVPPGEDRCISYSTISSIGVFGTSIGRSVIYNKQHLDSIAALVGDNYVIETEMKYQVFIKLKMMAIIFIFVLSFIAPWAIFFTLKEGIKKIKKNSEKVLNMPH